MKLTTQQIEYVEKLYHFEGLNGMSYKIELTDHMVTVWRFWAKDPELTFHQVKQDAEDTFGGKV
jgi:hypothetical protein